MKTIPCKVLLAFTSCCAFGQGSLTPPGPPGPTMKTLDQVEARIPIDPHKADFSLPYTINQPGSYYLTDDIIAAGDTAGIIIKANNVTIDLNGFMLLGGGGGSAAGINVPDFQDSLCIRNGTVRGWTKGGVRLINASNSRIEKVAAANNSNEAAISIGVGSIVSDCTAIDNFNTDGFFFSAFNNVAFRCVASGNHAGFFANGLTLMTDCSAYANASTGIAAASSTITRCSAAGNANGMVVTNSIVKECTVDSNTGDGISAGSRCLIEGNNCTSNADAGISVTGSENRVESNHTIDNHTGIAAIQGGNLIAKNANKGGSVPFSFAAGNSYGEITNVWNNGNGAVISSSNPWANFAY